MVAILLKQKDNFDSLDSLVFELLTHASKTSTVLIVTNALTCWVEYSAQSLLPRTYDLIRQKDVRVISAREMCSQGYEDEPSQWKLKCFMSLHERLQLRTDLLCNLVVVGDSMNEIIAGQ